MEVRVCALFGLCLAAIASVRLAVAWVLRSTQQESQTTVERTTGCDARTP